MTNYDLYKMLTTKEIEPKGWLLEQLKIQAEGLSGNLQRVWPDISDSQWIGGEKEGWERVPYWLDGFVPLAYLLKDEELIATAKKYIDFILSKQGNDPNDLYRYGWICPCKTHEELLNFDEWGVILICKALIVYHDCSGDERIPDVVYRIIKQLKWRLEHHAISTWGAYRWFETLIPIYWLYDRCHEDWLIIMCDNLVEQGADYRRLFSHWKDQEPHDTWKASTHVVNLAMALKCEAMAYRYRVNEGEDVDKESFVTDMLNKLLKYHGNVFDHFNGDECISGNTPIRGTETCGIVEAMYSYEWLYAITGNVKYIDHLEKLAFNMLPAALSEDMWVRQYNQMVNQVACPKFEGPEVPFMTNGPEGNMYGLETNYGCCTANFNQGWPKFALSTFMRSKTGLASVAHAPAKATLDINGAKVECELDTMYPFREKLTYTITTDRPVEFDFEIAIPSCLDAAIVDGVYVQTGAKKVISRVWEGTTKIECTFKFKVEFKQRPEGLVTLFRGPVAFALPIDAEWTKVEYTLEGIERKFPYCDYEVMPKSDWNYAYASDMVTFEEIDDYAIPFSGTKPPVVAYADMNKINWGWKEGFEGTVCREYPLEREPISEVERKKLIPYGGAKLRMTEMPIKK